MQITGNDNQISTSQIGIMAANDSSINLYGHANQIDVLQVGSSLNFDSNSSNINVDGNSNVVKVEQGTSEFSESPVSTVSEIDLSGAGNSIHVLQAGVGTNVSVIHTYGNGNTVSVKQQ